jgi:hypothetical protein
MTAGAVTQLGGVILGMQPLSFSNLAENAFRTLGISGSATQAEIDAAARRMRIFPDPSRIPASPWDRAALGEIARSKSDIERAVMLLQQPRSRLEHRLLWYCGSSPPPALTSTGFDGDAEDAITLPDAHNRAIAAMHGAWLSGGESPDASEWRDVVQRFRQLHGFGEYASWVASLETAGEFEKRSSPAEQAEAIRGVSRSIIQGIAAMAQASFDAGDADRGQHLLSIVHESGDDGVPADEALGRVLDRVEDDLDTLCRDVDDRLRDKLATNRQDPTPFYDQNIWACRSAEVTLQDKIRPTLQRFMALAASSPRRLDRGKSAVAELLVLLALGWEWSGEFNRALVTLNEAESLSDGSPSTSVTIEQQRERCEEKLQQLRPYLRAGDFTSSGVYYATGTMNRRAAPPKKQKSNWWLAWLGVAILSGVFRSMTGSSHSTRDAPDFRNYRIPQYREPDVPRITPEMSQSLSEALRRARERRGAMSRPSVGPFSRPVFDPYYQEPPREP